MPNFIRLRSRFRMWRSRSTEMPRPSADPLARRRAGRLRNGSRAWSTAARNAGLQDFRLAHRAPRARAERPPSRVLQSVERRLSAVARGGLHRCRRSRHGDVIRHAEIARVQLLKHPCRMDIARRPLIASAICGGKRRCAVPGIGGRHVAFLEKGKRVISRGFVNGMDSETCPAAI